MLQNAYFLANIGADTAENEQHFAENLPKIGKYPTGPELTSPGIYVAGDRVVDACAAQGLHESAKRRRSERPTRGRGRVSGRDAQLRALKGRPIGPALCCRLGADH